jgi:beta-N-acetylhexosaminidase
LQRLKLDGQVGQLIMVGTPIEDPTQVADTVRKYKLGGVFLAGRTTQAAATLKPNIQQLQVTARTATGIPLQIAADQEGGTVQTLKGPDFPLIPSAVAQGKQSDKTLRANTTGWARRVHDVGITLDLAPVSDTVPPGFAGSNPPIGELDRQYGSSPLTVADKVSVVVSAAQGTGLLTTLKHFPGLGRVRLNTDTSQGAVDNTTTATDAYLKPFASGIKAGTAAVMISSASYPKLDRAAIAAFSHPIVTDLLRKRLGFTGLVISDDLGAADAVSAVAVGDRAVRFVKAGGDMVLTVRRSDASLMSKALLAAAQSAPAFATQVAAAAGRVLRSKVRAGLLHC